MNMRSQVIIVFVAIVISLTGLWSCDGKKEPPPKATVVKKKIKAPATTKAERKLAAKPKQPRMRPKSDVAMIVPSPKVARAASTGQPSGKPVVKSSIAAAPEAVKPSATDSPSKLAQTSQPGTAGGGDAVQNRVSLSPKSDIAVDDTARAQAPAPAANKIATAPVEDTKTAPDTKSRIKPAALAPKQTAKPSMAATAKPAAKNAKSTPPPYDPTGKVNPFEPLFKDKPEVPATAKVRKKRVPRTPLERISLGQLKLVGIILASSGNRALVQESSGKGYIIKKGTYIGLNAGKVTEIRKDAVVIEEEVENVLGKVTKNTTELKLPKPPGE
jgi:type IV pilus assembly protein PilP